MPWSERKVIEPEYSSQFAFSNTSATLAVATAANRRSLLLLAGSTPVLADLTIDRIDEMIEWLETVKQELQEGPPSE